MTDHHEIEQETYDNTLFGFWVYLLTDFVMFAAIFATYIVLRHGTFDGPGPRDIFSIPYALMETLVLLTATLSVSLGGAHAKRGNKGATVLFFILTFILGTVFLCMEAMEFSHLIQAGYTWKTSGFLSIFYTLVGTLLIHVILGLIWILIFLPQFFSLPNQTALRRVMCLKMFWQFINLVWILIFSIVYLLGVA